MENKCPKHNVEYQCYFDEEDRRTDICEKCNEEDKVEICDICKQEKKLIKYAKSMMEYTHGFYQMICDDCYIKILEDKKKEIDKMLKDLKKREVKNGNKN